MPVIHHAIDVDAAPADCWRVFADLTRWPQWFPFLVAAQSLDGELRVGGRMELTFVVGGVRVTVPPRLEELTQAPFFLTGVGTRLGVRGDHSYRFDQTRAAPVRTRLTCHEEWSGLAARLMPARLVERLDDESHRSLERLAQLITAS